MIPLRKKGQHISLESPYKSQNLDDIFVEADTDHWVHFSQGQLHVLGRNEQELHGGGNRLYLQTSRELPFIPFVDFSTLHKLYSQRFPTNLRGKSKTRLKHSVLGGLQVRRELSPTIRLDARFSRDEERYIRAYVKAWAEHYGFK